MQSAAAAAIRLDRALRTLAVDRRKLATYTICCRRWFQLWQFASTLLYSVVSPYMWILTSESRLIEQRRIENVRKGDCRISRIHAYGCKSGWDSGGTERRIKQVWLWGGAMGGMCNAFWWILVLEILKHDKIWWGQFALASLRDFSCVYMSSFTLCPLSNTAFEYERAKLSVELFLGDRL